MSSIVPSLTAVRGPRPDQVPDRPPTTPYTPSPRISYSTRDGGRIADLTGYFRNTRNVTAELNSTRGA